MNPRIRPVILLWIPPMAWAAVIFRLSSISFPPTPLTFPFEDKVAHVAVYGLLGLLLALALRHERAWNWRRAAWIAFAAGALYGISDELHQLFVPLRDCDFFDWIADAAGAFLGAFALPFLMLARARRPQKRTPGP